MFAMYVVFLFQVLSMQTILTLTTVALVASLGLDGTEAFRLVFVDIMCSYYMSVANHICPPWHIFSAYSKKGMLQEVT
jgi:hypothetical protein